MSHDTTNMDSAPQKMANKGSNPCEQIRDLFTVPFCQKAIDLSRVDNALVACCNFDEMPMVTLVKWDKPLMAGSVVCSKLAQVIAAAAAYPQAAAPTPPKFITMKEIPKVPFLAQESFIDLLTLLPRNEAQDFVSKIVCIVGSSLELYENVFTTGVLTLIADLPVFPSTAFYAFRIMFLEELAMYYGKRGPGRFVLPRDAVSKLPAEATSAKDPSLGNFTTSPWMGTLAQKICVTNGLTLPAMLVGERRACTLAEFEDRFAQYTKGILDHLKWSDDGTTGSPKYRTAFTGSSMAACAAKNPLETTVDSFADYITEYYPGRTREMVKKSTTFTTNDSMMTFFTDDDANPATVDTTPVEKPATDGPVDYTDMDLMVECRLEDFDAVAENHFKSIKKAAVEATSLTWPAEDVIMEYVKTENKHKYIIRGLPREIDIFHVDSIEAVIVKYHLGCVRLWYDGSQVWCLPSFVTAANLGLNLDIRWVSNKKDVRDTVLKYFQRGFGTLLNHVDRANLLGYVNASDVWPHITPPAVHGWAGHRNLRRFNSSPMFSSVFHQMFNPSASRKGIHYSLPTSKHITRKSSYDLPRREVYHRRRAGPNGTMKNCDFKTYAGKGLLPVQCQSLQPYF